MNKVLFDSIISDYSRIDRYKAPNSVSQIPIEVEDWLQGNIFPTSGWTKSGDTIISQSGITIQADSAYSSTNDISKAFDDNSDTYLRPTSTSASTDFNIKISFDESKKISKFYVSVSLYQGTSYQVTVSISGSNDELTWASLATTSGTGGYGRDITINNPDFYKYYKIGIRTSASTSSSRYFQIKEIKTSEYWGKKTVDFNVLTYDYYINEYANNMRALIDVQTDFQYFSQSIIPVLTAADVPVNGYYYTYATASGTGNVNRLFDKDDNTYGSFGSNAASIISLHLPIGIKNFKAKIIVRKGSGDYIIQLLAREKGQNNFTSIQDVTLTGGSGNETFEISVQNDKVYDAVGISHHSPTSTSSSVLDYYTFDITEGYAETFQPGEYSYININNLGNKMINQQITLNKKYELVYDGNAFNAREVVL